MTNKAITVNYTLFKDTEKGELIETTTGKQPLIFLSGLGQMIPQFEEKVAVLDVGGTFSFGIKATDAYGERTDEAIIELPQDMFMKDGKMVEEVKPGNVLPLEDQEGRVHPAKIVSINENTVTADVNHPLAGQDLHFTGTVEAVREATEKEIEHGHVHQEGSSCEE